MAAKRETECCFVCVIKLFSFIVIIRGNSQAHLADKMVLNPVEKLRKQKQKQVLSKQKKQRQLKNKEKFTKLSREDVEREHEKLKRKPKSNVDEKDVQRLKSLEKRLLEETKTAPKNDIGPTALNGGVKSGNGNKIAYDDYVGDAARDAKDSVYYHPTLNPLGKPPPGKPQKYVQRKRGGKADAGMALQAPEKRKRKRGENTDGEGGTESSSEIGRAHV